MTQPVVQATVGLTFHLPEPVLTSTRPMNASARRTPRVWTLIPMKGSGQRLLGACPPKPIPPAASRFDDLRIAFHPLRHRRQWHFERPAKVSELIQRGRLDPPTVEMAGNEPVAFRSAKRLSQYLVRDPVQGVMDVLVAAPSLGQLRDDSESPTPGQQLNQSRRLTASFLHSPRGY